MAAKLTVHIAQVVPQPVVEILKKSLYGYHIDKLKKEASGKNGQVSQNQILLLSYVTRNNKRFQYGYGMYVCYKLTNIIYLYIALANKVF